MSLDDLSRMVREHSGTFLCHRIHDEEITKCVHFEHVVGPVAEEVDVPELGRLREFYATFGSILFYHDEKSGDAGRYLAHPSEWPGLEGELSGWLDMLDEDERDDCLPGGVDACLVIGETPQSGNYILVQSAGDAAGQVFEFDHDGLEFTHCANDIVEYVHKLLRPDGRLLTNIASHMRFVEGDSTDQWWIQEMKDNAGFIVQTSE